MRRILRIGCPGAGKSTLAREIGRRTGIAVTHLDRLYWGPGWKERPREVFLEYLENRLRSESWIIDGNYASTLADRLELADLVVYLDYPTWLTLWRVLRRIILGYGRVRPDMADGCPEKLDWEFLRYVWAFRKRNRPEVEEVVADHAHPNLFRATGPSVLDRWLAAIDWGADGVASGGSA